MISLNIEYGRNEYDNLNICEKICTDVFPDRGKEYSS